MNHAVKSLVISLALISLSCATFSEDNLSYREALREATSGNRYFAVIKLEKYLQEFPESSHSQEVRFAVCEYLVDDKNYSGAIRKLKGYIQDYSNDKSTVFAKALLYLAISRYKTEPELIEKIRQDFFSKSLLLVFSDSKSNSYTSILNNTYKIVDYLDRVEFFKNDFLFLTVTP
ncbi:MAG: hypothetical protein A3K83_07075 [Omnitrophica WOR_2 bacterium RBG_13_44_8b]|nr:MAG: hypothetical protein A3K83_07075 [Omnitrophica WOR_2 bacterium RBG_13_44_8b]